MIFIDEHGYPVNETMDGMDSAVREGILQITQPEEWKNVKDPESYENKGYLMRHPLTPPADNEWNNTRDNMIPMIAALYARGKTAALRRVFWATVKRGFFSQSVERDVRWSRKKLYPHIFWKDSYPNTDTRFYFPKLMREPLLSVVGMKPGRIVETEFRWADWADPFMLDHIAMLIKATGYWLFYPFMVPGLAWLRLSFWMKRNQDQTELELNQLFCQCFVLGPYWLKKIKTLPNWDKSFKRYWSSRNEAEYADLICKYLEQL
jgi:hypothetical protein